MDNHVDPSHLDPSQLAPPTSDTDAPSAGGLFVSTMNDLPGYEIVTVIGTAFGLGTCSSGTYKAAKGAIARSSAIAEMCSQATSWGANAVLAMRFDTAALGWAQNVAYEVAAYGTAVVVRPMTSS